MPNTHSSELYCGVIQWLLISKCGRDGLEGCAHMNRQKGCLDTAHDLRVMLKFHLLSMYLLKFGCKLALELMIIIIIIIKYINKNIPECHAINHF